MRREDIVSGSRGVGGVVVVVVVVEEKEGVTRRRCSVIQGWERRVDLCRMWGLDWVVVFRFLWGLDVVDEGGGGAVVDADVESGVCLGRVGVAIVDVCVCVDG